jgi:glycosyltransferase involved in cell wall biosynthesis
VGGPVLKILLVHNTYQQPGGEDVVFGLERHLLEETGHQVATYCRSNFEVSASPMGRLTWIPNTVWSDSSRRAFARLLRQQKPDVVHVHNTFFMISSSIYSACRAARVPVVQTLHNFRLLCPGAAFFRQGHVCEECADHSLWRSLRHVCYRDSRLATGTVALMLAVHRFRRTWVDEVDSFIVLTEFARRKFIDGGLPENKLRVLPNFASPDTPAGASEGEYALFVGRLSPEKGLGTLLSAWGLLPRRIPLVVVGDGPLRPELEAEAAKLGLSNVVFRGRLARAETQAAMQGAKFLILPSECYENFPMTIVEAFACGVPAVCSQLGALPEIVEDGRTGLHFAPYDSRDLAAKVDWAWTHGGQMRTMGRNAQAEFEAKYTAGKHYSALMEIYAGAMRPVPAFNRIPSAAPAPAFQTSGAHLDAPLML